MSSFIALIGGIWTLLLMGGTAQQRQTIIRVHSPAGLRQALVNAKPGTNVLVAPGEYSGGLYFSDLHGAPNNPIIIRAADPENPPLFRGGTGCLHFSDVSYLELHDLVLVGATGNGLNVDDGGNFDLSTHHIVLRGLTVRDIGPKGNRDGIILSGVRDFRVDGCVIERWGDRGQGIDMVGCHNGLIVNCTLRFKDDNGYGVQTKGGSSNIVVRRCRFERAGARAMQIGGSTGLKVFRPPLRLGEEHAEARNIMVEGCVFVGSQAPVTFVGVDGAVVRFNTIYRPKRWAIRILQETKAEGFVPCRNGAFTDNLVVFRSDEWAHGGMNIGPDTAPQTFAFARNWWYCLDNPALSKPHLPVPEKDGVIGVDPLLRNPEAGDFSVKPDSSAKHVGAHAFR